jgi:ribokinase
VTSPCVIVTLGHRGCCARANGALLLQAGFPVLAVDSTGAGDTFCGTLVGALGRGEPVAHAIRTACAAAALACARLGAQSSIPSRAEVAALLDSAVDRKRALLDELAAHCGFEHA